MFFWPLFSKKKLYGFIFLKGYLAESSSCLHHLLFFLRLKIWSVPDDERQPNSMMLPPLEKKKCA